VAVEEVEVRIADAELADLEQRLEATRFIEPPPDPTSARARCAWC
jgi:hypothetical protein